MTQDAGRVVTTDPADVASLAMRLASNALALHALADRLVAHESDPSGAINTERLAHWQGLVDVAIAACPVGQLGGSERSAILGGPQPIGLGPRWTFKRAGDYWAIGGPAVSYLRDAKGLAYLAFLLANPGREHHALDLAQADHATAQDHRSPQPGHPEITCLDGGASEVVLDPRARSEYQGRLRELRDEIAESEAMNDWQRASAARQEADWLAAELTAAYGLRGRPRQFPSPAERARQSVTKAIRSTIRRIALQDQDLASHLERNVSTGRTCSYDPDPGTIPTWEL